MGSPINHMIFTLPIFHDGEIAAFFASMAHWPDVGGVLGGVTRDIYAEMVTRTTCPSKPVKPRSHCSSSNAPSGKARAALANGVAVSV